MFAYLESLDPHSSEFRMNKSDPSIESFNVARGDARGVDGGPLAGAVVAIGNAPTALFHLLEMLAAGADRPAAILGFPVGFVGAADAKEALIEFGEGLGYITLRGRRCGSALAAAAVNALTIQVGGGVRA